MTSRASSTDWTSLTESVNSDISGEAGALASANLPRNLKWLELINELISA